jgi:hypothetical protein
MKTVDVTIKKTFEEKQGDIKVGMGELTITENCQIYCKRLL